MNDWLADVSGEVAAALIVAALLSIGAYFTPWGKRLGRLLGRASRRSWSLLRSVRVTTRTRIDAEIAEAVHLATMSDQNADPDGTHARRPEDYDGWVLGPAAQPRHWELRNQTGETATVEAIIPSGPYWPFEWEDPDFPVLLGAGESVLIPARRVRMGNHLMPWMDQAMANVIFEDEHGDEREDVIWILE